MTNFLFLELVFRNVKDIQYKNDWRLDKSGVAVCIIGDPYVGNTYGSQYMPADGFPFSLIVSVQYSVTTGEIDI